MIYVVAGSWEEYRAWCHDAGLTPRDAVYLHDRRQLQGRRLRWRDQVVQTGRQPRDWPALAQELEHQLWLADLERPVSPEEQAAIHADAVRLWRDLVARAHQSAPQPERFEVEVDPRAAVAGETCEG